VSEIWNPHIRENAGQLENCPVNCCPRLLERAHDVQKQHRPDFVCHISCDVLVGVVEQDSFALFPVVRFTTHNKRALVFTRNLNPEVHTENARPRTFVRHQHLVWAEHGDVGGNYVLVFVED
jgi:hypothetical protein